MIAERFQIITNYCEVAGSHPFTCLPLQVAVEVAVAAAAAAVVVVVVATSSS